MLDKIFKQKIEPVIRNFFATFKPNSAYVFQDWDSPQHGEPEFAFGIPWADDASESLTAELCGMLYHFKEIYIQERKLAEGVKYKAITIKKSTLTEEAVNQPLNRLRAKIRDGISKREIE